MKNGGFVGIVEISRYIFYLQQISQACELFLLHMGPESSNNSGMLVGHISAKDKGLKLSGRPITSKVVSA